MMHKLLMTSRMLYVDNWWDRLNKSNNNFVVEKVMPPLEYAALYVRRSTHSERTPWYIFILGNIGSFLIRSRSDNAIVAMHWSLWYDSDFMGPCCPKMWESGTTISRFIGHRMMWSACDPVALNLGSEGDHCVLKTLYDSINLCDL